MELGRRHLLAVLGVGVVGAGVQTYDRERGDGPGAGGFSREGTGHNGSFDAKVKRATSDLPDRRPALSFEYAPIEGTFDDSSLFRWVKAKPDVDEAGDRLRVRPAGRSAEEAAGLLRDVWNVGESVTVETSVQDATVAFTGGEATDAAYLVGVGRIADEPEVFVARGREMKTARTIAQTFEVLLE